MGSEGGDLIMMTSEIIAKARKDKMWIYLAFNDRWFSPDELEAAFPEWPKKWSANSFTLRDPEELLTKLSNQMRTAKAQFFSAKARVEKSKK